jgi:alkylation response protein AidB-like acyl-CoA dehydrogenase
MYVVHRFGSEKQKQRWLPGMAAGETIGCGDEALDASGAGAAHL